MLQAVQRLAGTAVALGIVPMGTGNLLATNLGVPKRLPDAVEVLLQGSRRQIDVGRVKIGSKERVFSVACGIGFDAKVMEYARQFVPPNKASKAVGRIKRAVQTGAEIPFESALALERGAEHRLLRHGLGPH